MEKISEIPVREEKIKRLKAKILSEIEYFSNITEREIRLHPNAKDEKNRARWSELISTEYYLLKLREFIERDGSFNAYEARYDSEDIIIYMISDEIINIWLNETYNFTSTFLFKVECEGYDTHQILNDKFLGYNFTSIFDKMAYDRKLEQES